MKLNADSKWTAANQTVLNRKQNENANTDLKGYLQKYKEPGENKERCCLWKAESAKLLLEGGGGTLDLLEKQKGDLSSWCFTV